MQRVYQKIQFIKDGLNSDVTAELNSGLPFAKNVRIFSTNDNSAGSVTTVNGNVSVAYTLPRGQNKCIGYYRDALQQKGYADIWNKEGYHSILQYDEVANTITAVFIDDIAITGQTTGSILNFQEKYLITGGEVVEKDNENHLYGWTDGYLDPTDNTIYNEPKKINVEAGILFTAGTYTGQYTFPFNKKWIDRIKEPPPAPSYAWSGLLASGTQFKAFCDPQFSATATAFTTIAFPSANPNVLTQFDVVLYQWTVPSTGFWALSTKLGVQGGTVGEVSDATVRIRNITAATTLGSDTETNIGTADTNKFVQIVTNTTELTAGDVYEVQISLSNQTMPNTTIVLVGQTVDQLSAFTFQATYYGQTTINNVFDRFFQFQQSYGFIDGEESVLSEKTNYILPKTSLTLPSTGEEYAFQDNRIRILLNTGSSIVQKLYLYGHEIGAEAPSDTLSDVSLIISFDKLELGIPNDTTYEYIFLNDGNYTPISLEKKNQLMDFVPYAAQAEEFFKDRIGLGCVTEDVDAVTIDARFPMTFDEEVQINSTNTHFPTRTYYKAGAIYVEAYRYMLNGGRLSNAFITVGKQNELQNNGTYGTTVHVPFLTQGAYSAPPLPTPPSNPDLLMKYVPTIRAFTYHLPKSDFIRYSICRSKMQNIAGYIQFVSKALRYIDAAGGTVSAALAVNIEIDIGNIIGQYKTENKLSQLVYDWTKGDRIRFIAQRSGNSTINARYQYNDTEITDFASGTQKVYIKAGIAPLTMGFNEFFEIYTPSKTIENDNELVFEVGQEGSVELDDNGYLSHVPDFNSTTPPDLSIETTFTLSTPTYNPTTNTLVVTYFGVLNFAVGDNIWTIGYLLTIPPSLDAPVWNIYGTITNITGFVITIDTTGFLMNGDFVVDTFGKIHPVKLVNQLTQLGTTLTFTSPTTVEIDLVDATGYEINDNVKLFEGDVPNGATITYSIYGTITAITVNVVEVTVDLSSAFGTFVGSLAGTLIRCAEQTFSSGDCFRRVCRMPCADALNPTVDALSNYIECMDASNMFDSQAWDYGRPNRIDNNAERITRPSTVLYSQNFIPETNVNGLSTILEGNFESYNRNYGRIEKLFYQNERLIAFQELKVLPILANQQVVETPEGGGLTSTTVTVLSPQQKIDYYLQDFGIGLHPESFAYFGNRKYFFDVKRGAVLRLSQDGITNISEEANMRVFFADLCQKILLCETKVNCWGVYDVRFGEYILTVQPFTYTYQGDLLVFDGITIAWNEKMNQFSTTYSYLPDAMGQTGVDILSFKDGGLWLHNLNTLQQNKFYGVQDNSEIWIYCNVSPSDIKVFTDLGLEATAIWEAIDIITPSGQSSELLTIDFKEIEGQFFAPILKDKNTPNVDFPIVQGDPVRGQWCLFKLRYSADLFAKLYSVNISFIISNLHNP